MKLVEEVIIRQLPKVKVSKRTLSKIKGTIVEMKDGKRITLEELRSV